MDRLRLTAWAFVAALLLAPLASAQTVGAPLALRTGDAFTVNVVYTQSADIGGEELNATMTYVYAVHVLDADTRLWRFLPITVAYEMPEMPGIEAQAANVNWAAMSDVMSAMMRIGTDVGFECRVDAYGRCEDMTNWPFWSARVENMALAFDGIARMIPPRAAAAQEAPPEAIEPPPQAIPSPKGGAGSGSDEASLQLAAAETPAPAAPAMPDWETIRVPVLQGVARLIDNFDSRDAAATMSGLYYPALVQGRTLTRREAVPFTDTYEMPFNAPPLRYSGTLRLDSINRRDNTAIVTRRAALDPQSARAALTGMTEFISAALVEPLAPHFPESQQPPNGAALAEMLNSMLADLQYEETTRGVIDLSSGLARETTTDYTMSVRMIATEEPVAMRGRVVTRVTPVAPDIPRLPRAAQ